MNITEQSVPSTTNQSLSPNVMKYIVLYNGEAFYTVRQDFYDSVLYQVEEILPALIPGETYTLEMLCGPAFWGLLDSGEPEMAGRCMADMVRRGLLPLRFARSRHEYALRYQLA